MKKTTDNLIDMMGIWFSLSRGMSFAQSIKEFRDFVERDYPHLAKEFKGGIKEVIESSEEEFLLDKDNILGQKIEEHLKEIEQKLFLQNSR